MTFRGHGGDMSSTEMRGCTSTDDRRIGMENMVAAPAQCVEKKGAMVNVLIGLNTDMRIDAKIAADVD